MRDWLWHAEHVHVVKFGWWQVEQSLFAPPWFIGKLWGPLYCAGRQAVVLWQLLQLWPVNMPAWKAGSLWHEAQAAGNAPIVFP